MYVLFLFRQEKNEKKPTKGALRANSAPFGNPRRPTASASDDRTILDLGYTTIYLPWQHRKCVTGEVHREGAAERSES